MSVKLLEINSVTKSFGNKIAVNNISLTLEKGEIYGFLGPNGAGKTTTIRMIMDFIRPTSGNISLFGNDNKDGVSEAMQKIGYLSADSVLYPNWTAMQHINFVNIVRQKKSNALALAKQFELDLNTYYHRLSSGNKQKLALILSLMNEPELLILDEPTRGLDPLLQQEIYTLLMDFKNNGGSVFMSSHNLSEVQKVCDRVIIIKEGKIVKSETMESLRKIHVHQVTVQFAKAINMSQFNLINVEIVKENRHNLVVNVKGDLNEFIKIISTQKIIDLEIGHISLEDTFMRFYK